MDNNYCTETGIKSLIQQYIALMCEIPEVFENGKYMYLLKIEEINLIKINYNYF